MARMPSWIRVVSDGPTDDGRRITLALAPFWWARPGFWLFWLRMRRRD